MAELAETPRGNRVHIAFFGLRNAGKSTLVNSFTGQNIAIVSDVAGTTTDPVSKAMEVLPLGPCMITDTAGLDDVGALGEMRVEKTLKVLSTADVAVWVCSPCEADNEWRRRVEADCASRRIPLLFHRREDSVDALKSQIASLRLADVPPGLLDGLVKSGDRVVCVCPIDESAPKGRLILPQVQVIRECLDIGATCIVCQPATLPKALEQAGEDGVLAVTDSQAFGEVRNILSGRNVRLTSFSILFARQKGDVAEYAKGLAAIKTLADGDRVLIAEGCTHHRQCNDIGTVKIPKALAKVSGRTLRFSFASGGDFDLASMPEKPRLVVQCGGCMLTRREVLRRIAICRENGVPIVNYGMLLAFVNGLGELSPEGLVSV